MGMIPSNIHLHMSVRGMRLSLRLKGELPSMQLGTACEGMIHPVRRKGDPHLGTVALMVMLPHELKRLVRESGAIELPFGDIPLCSLYQAEGLAGESPIALAGPFIGAPHAVMGLEKLMVLGASRIWVLGWCGSLQPNLTIGDLVIPVRAISEEGTSRHYPLAGERPGADPAQRRMLTEALRHAGREAREGDIWTTDAIYRETPEKVRHFHRLGILSVEMEMSALLTVASYRRSTLAALLVVSDELFHPKWRPGFSDPRLKESTRLAGDLLLGLSRAMATGAPLE